MVHTFVRWRRTPAFYIAMFCITLITTTAAGAEWRYGNLFWWVENPMGIKEFLGGMEFSLPLLLALTVHEFGHYFTARKYGLDVSYPFYIPMYLGFLGMPTIGTMGAVISIRSRMYSRKEFFDVGIAGPLAGFVIAILTLWYGFTHLPPLEYLFEIHPSYKQYGSDYASYVYKDAEGALKLGKTLLYIAFEKWVCPTPELLPNSYEIIHYPYLFAGYMALFFTALNLLPLGQLDGGHILFGLIGHKAHKKVSLSLFIVFITYAGIGLFSVHRPIDEQVYYVIPYLLYLYLVFQKAFEDKIWVYLVALSVFITQLWINFVWQDFEGYTAWILFGFILGRVLGIYHPEVLDDRPLSLGRKILGWLVLLIFIVCFSPAPFGM